MHDPFGFDSKPPKTKRTTISKSVWESLKHTHGNKCVLCGKSEKAVGELQKAHIRAASRGNDQTVLPMCPTCHRKYDKGKATAADLKKLNLTRAQYNRMIPKPGTVKGKSKSNIDIFSMPKVDIPKFDLPKIDSPFDPNPKKKKKSQKKKSQKKDDDWGFL